MVLTMVNNHLGGMMRTIKASVFKAQCLQLMDEVAETGERLMITKRGKPVSILSPYPQKPATLFGRHRESLKIRGDILAPIDEKWDAER